MDKLDVRQLAQAAARRVDASQQVGRCGQAIGLSLNLPLNSLQLIGARARRALARAAGNPLSACESSTRASRTAASRSQRSRAFPQQIRRSSRVGAACGTARCTSPSTSARQRLRQTSRPRNPSLSLMQPSMFNLRVPLAARDDVFLMNTLTDAQLSCRRTSRRCSIARPKRDVSGRLGRGSARGARPALARTASSSRAAPPIGRRSTATSTAVKSDTVGAERHGADDAAVQLRLRLLLPGRSRRLQQVRREDVARDGARASATGSSASSIACSPEKLVLTFFGGEPLLNLPVMYHLAERHVARHAARAACELFVNIITNGLLLTRGGRRSLLPFGLNGVKITLDGDRDTHNRMRPLRGGQGTFDRIVENIRARRRPLPDRDRRQLRRELGRQLSGAARVPAASRTSPTSSSRSTSSRSSAPRRRRAAEGHPPARPRSAPSRASRSAAPA